MSMINYITNLFQDMSLLTMVLLGAGVLLCVCEVFVPKFGITGVLGIVLLGTGMSSYYIDGFKFSQMVALLSIIALILALFVFIELILESKGVIHSPNRYKFRTYNGPSSQLNAIVGRIGKAVTNINLGGTIDVDGKLYYAISSMNIAVDSLVQVVGVENNALIVKVYNI